MTIVPEDLSISNYEEHYLSSPVFLCNSIYDPSVSDVRDHIHLQEYCNPDRWSSEYASLHDNYIVASLLSK